MYENVIVMAEGAIMLFLTIVTGETINKAATCDITVWELVFG